MKLAIVCGGKAQLSKESPLQYIADTLNDVVISLEKNSWTCIRFTKASSTKEYIKLFENYKGSKIDEFLFYYIGHGSGSKHEEFEIHFESHSLTVHQVKNNTKEALGRYPKRMAFVLDACYSGNAVDSKSDIKDIELLTAKDRDSQAFECDVKERTEFSYYFCKVFETSQNTDCINLENIADYIAGAEQTGEDVFYLPNPSRKQDKITIGYNKEINKIRKELNKKFPLKKLKEQSLLYFHTENTSFNTFVNAKSFDEALSILLLNQNCLFCLLKELGLDYASLKRVDEDFDCLALKKEVLESRKIIGIILKIEMKGNDKHKCRVSGWKKLNSMQYRPIPILDTLVDFTEEKGEASYVETLTKYLKEKVLEGSKPKAQLELELMLPYKLFDVDFGSLKFEKFETWGQAFNLSKRFLNTYYDYSTADRLDNLKSNSKKYNDLELEALKDLACLEIKTLEDKNNIDRYNDKDKNYILLTSNYSLIDKLMEMQHYGVPHIITPSEEYACMAKDIDFKDKCVNEMNNVLFSFVKDHRNHCKIHFIYDNYDDLKFLTKLDD